MAVTGYKEIHNGRQGGTRLSRDGRSIRTYTRVFRVTTDSNYTEGAAVKSCGIPLVGAVYPYDIAAYCQEVIVGQADNSKQVWTATCNYSTEREISTNPLSEPAQIEFDTEPYQRPYYKDRDGNVIANKAGTPLVDPPIMGDASRVTVLVRKNVAAVPTWIYQYRDAVNSDAISVRGLGVAAGKAKVMRLAVSDIQERNNIYYFVFSYALALSDSGWAVEYPNMGFQEIDSGDTTKRIDILIDGEPVQTPWPLDNSGYAIDNPTTSSLIMLEANIYNEKPFNGYLPLS